MSAKVRDPTPLLIVKGVYESAGGPETVLQVIAGSLDRDRFPPRLALLARKGEDLPPILAEVSACMPTSRLDWHGIAGAPLSARQLARLVADHPGAILHTNDMRANLLAWLIRRVRRVPWIAHVHGWLGPTHSGRHRLFEEIDRWLIRDADLVLVGSTAMHGEVVRAGAKRVEIVTNGVHPSDPTLFAAQAAEIRARVAPKGGLVAGMLGRLHPGKGQMLFIEALAGLRAKGMAITGVIVGTGAAEAEYRTLVQRLGLADHVYFAGLVPDVRPWLCAMDMLCVPSLKDSMPMSAMEAMSVGIPVIASRTGELPIAIEDGRSGLIVEVGSVPSLAAAMERLALSRDERVQFGHAGRERLIQHYSPAAMLRLLQGSCEMLALDEVGRGQ